MRKSQVRGSPFVGVFLLVLDLVLLRLRLWMGFGLLVLEEGSELFFTHPENLTPRFCLLVLLQIIALFHRFRMPLLVADIADEKISRIFILFANNVLTALYLPLCLP